MCGCSHCGRVYCAGQPGVRGPCTVASAIGPCAVSTAGGGRLPPLVNASAISGSPRSSGKFSLQDVAALIRSGACQRVVVMVGAGISTPSGIPDFRYSCHSDALGAAAMLCCAMPCHTLLCHTLPFYTLPCHTLLSHPAMLCSAKLCYSTPCSTLPRPALPHPALLCHALLCHALLSHTLLACSC